MTAPVLIYLAGPHVFERDARAVRHSLKLTCERHGLVGIWPSDNEPPAALSSAERARRIFEENIDRIREAHGMLADLRSFRGTEPDSGTAFEVGMAYALGIPVVAYGVPPWDYIHRVSAALAVRPDAAGTLRDSAGLAVEDFGLPVNLMLACAASLKPSADEAAAELARILLPASPA
jgi:nucleoside 2-deoxyribosyltransferase